MTEATKALAREAAVNWVFTRLGIGINDADSQHPAAETECAVGGAYLAAIPGPMWRRRA